MVIETPTKKDIRIFLFIWGCIFLLLALYPLLEKDTIRYWALILAVPLFLVALLKPLFAVGIYKIWITVGDFIGNIMSKLIMLVLFYGVFTPIAILLKILGKDLLNKKIEPDAKTYWISRSEKPGSMKYQF